MYYTWGTPSWAPTPLPLRRHPVAIVLYKSDGAACRIGRSASALHMQPQRRLWHRFLRAGKCRGGRCPWARCSWSSALIQRLLARAATYRRTRVTRCRESRLCTLHVAVGGLLLTDALRHTHRAKRKTQPCDIAAHSDGNGGCLQTQYGSSPAQRFATRLLAWGSQRSRRAAWRRSRIRSGRRRRSAPSRSRRPAAAE